MAAPNIQISDNSSYYMKIFWELDTSGTYSGYKLYWGTTTSPATQIGGVLPNSYDLLYSKEHVFYKFNRPVAENTGFYLKLVGVLASSGADDSGNPSAVKYIPAMNEDLPENSVARLFGYDPTAGIWRKVVVTKDTSSEGGDIHTV